MESNHNWEICGVLSISLLLIDVSRILIFSAIYYEIKLPENIMSYRENIKKRSAFKEAMLKNYKSSEVLKSGTT